MLRYGGVVGDEQEVVIRLDAQDGQAHICSTWPAWSRKFEKRYGIPPKYQERDDFMTVAFWILPIKAISIRRPVKPSQTPRRSGGFRPGTSTKVPVEGSKR